MIPMEGDVLDFQEKKQSESISYSVSCRDGFGLVALVPVAGLEPARGCPHRILSATRLPFHHTGFFSLKTDRPWRGDLADNGGGEWI